MHSEEWHGQEVRGGFFDYGPLLAAVGLCGTLVAYYLFVVWPYIRIPADILMFAESDFVGTIIKLRTGAPLFTPPSDNNSLVYTPLSPVLTYGIAWMAGQATSIPAYRAVQLGFAAVAAALGVVCCRRLYAMRWPGLRLRFPKTYSVFAFLLLFLAATSPRVNAYASSLHADALAVLVTVFTFWRLLRYLEAPSRWRFVLLAACPAMGFLTKQFLFIWAPLACLVLLIADPRQWRRVVGLALLSFAFFGLTVGVCYALWGDAFVFFIFDVVGGKRGQIGLSSSAYHISLLRSLNHLVLAWLEVMVGAVGAWWLSRHSTDPKIVGITTAWAALIAGETLTSGAGWEVLYHFGPGVVFGTILLLAAIPSIWLEPKAPATWPSIVPRVGHAAFMVAAVLAVAVALRVVPTGVRGPLRAWPPRGPSPDMQRYITDIEREFEGQPVDRVLLDIGNWIYLPHAHLAKDRAISVADQPPIGIYDNIEAFARRIRSQEYSKILVRNFHAPVFLYDWYDWPRPSGVRAALLEYYQEVRTIRGVTEEDRISGAFIAPVSVFEPRHNR